MKTADDGSNAGSLGSRGPNAQPRSMRHHKNGANGVKSSSKRSSGPRRGAAMLLAVFSVVTVPDTSWMVRSAGPGKIASVGADTLSGRNMPLGELLAENRFTTAKKLGAKPVTKPQDFCPSNSRRHVRRGTSAAEEKAFNQYLIRQAMEKQQPAEQSLA